MDLNFIFKWAAKLFFAKFLPGKKTLILAWILKLWGVAELALFYMPQIANTLCESINICIANTVIYGYVITILGILVNISRWSTKIFPELKKE